MILTCPACGSKSSIDDSKVPDRAFQARCAKCEKLFRVDPPAPEPEAPPAPSDPGASALGEPESNPAGAAARPSPETAPEPPAVEEEPEMFAPRGGGDDAEVDDPGPAAGGGDDVSTAVQRELQKLMPLLMARGGASVSAAVPANAPALPGIEKMTDGQPLALVAVASDEEATPVREAFLSLGYRVVRVNTMKKALSQLDDREPQCIVVGSAFPGEEGGGKSLLRRLSGLTPEQRRATVVSFISPKFKSMDGLPAFVLGADFVIASADLSRVRDLLREGIRGKEQMYRAFRRAQQRLLA